MNTITRNTQVFSISLPERIALKLEELRQVQTISRSAFITALIEKELENERWRRIYKRGEQTAENFKITSEEDIDRIIHEL